MLPDSSQIRVKAAENGIPLCEAILRAFQYLVKTQNEPWRTLLAVCPNSEAVLRAALLAAKWANSVIKFAATLNQVDLDGGYTGWTQPEFVELVRKSAEQVDYTGPIVVSVDHAGPWLKDKHSIEDWSFEDTMNAVKKSLEAAIDAGYDLLHIDPTVDKRLPANQTIDINTVVEQTASLIEHCEIRRKERGLPRIAYEVGTEEVKGGLADLSRVHSFLIGLRSQLYAKGIRDVWPCFVVGMVGTDLHTTEFNPKMATALYEEVYKYGSLIKGHYTDNVTNPTAYPASRMGGANVGPEFTQVECRALANLVEMERSSSQIKGVTQISQFNEVLQAAVVSSGRWQKWLQPEEQGKAFEHLSPERQQWLVMTGARYIWTSEQVQNARARLYDNLRNERFDPDRYVVEYIAQRIMKYFKAFNLIDSLPRLEQEFRRRDSLPFWGEGDIVSAGELIVEIMRPNLNQPLDQTGQFNGPFASGAPAIFADAAAKIGKKVGFIGSVGRDEFGSLLRQRLKDDGVDVSSISIIDGKATGCAFVSYFKNGSRKFIYHIADTASGQFPEPGGIGKYATAFRHCHLMGCSLAINDSICEVGMALAKTVKESGGTVSLDPNLRPEILSIEQCRNILLPLVKMADIILPSGDEACLLTGDSETDTACRRLIEMGVQVVVLKLGERGCRVYSPDGVFDVPGFAVEAVDPTGAGDCFDAGFVSGYLDGMSLVNAAKLANAMGALGVSRKGPMEGTFRWEKVESFIRGSKITPRRINKN